MAEPLAINFGLAASAMALLWLLALRLRDVSFIDAVWGGGMADSTCRIDQPCFPDVHVTRWSGKPFLEQGFVKSRPGYSEYIKRTSGFVPWPSKRR